MSRYGWRPYLESARRLDIRRMFATGAAQPGKQTTGLWHWTLEGKQVACIGYHANVGEVEGELILDYTCKTRLGENKPITSAICLSSTPLNYGGRRWYMICPITERQALILYKWRDIDLFCHRDAIRPRPTYASQRDSGCDRIIRQRWALRRKMGDRISDLFGEPYKPKRMRESTYEKYVARDAELAAREAPFFARFGCLVD